MINPFAFRQPGKIEFGAGRFSLLGNIINRFGRNALIVASASFAARSPKWCELEESLKRNKTRYHRIESAGEPSPDFIDSAAAEFRNKNINVVAAIGGGSVTDAGKAISAMIPQDRPVAEFLFSREGVGAGAHHNGIKVPFIAVPTTAGTGSEATKNAVLSRVGPDGFKKSIRHDNFIPDLALIDPELSATCPPHVTAACGMDALSQLLESFVSTKSNPMTDALAFGAIELSAGNLASACAGGGADIAVRAVLAYASLVSGITLANAGLGVVHGIAGPIGGFFRVPHGVACGTLIAPANRITIEKLLDEKGPDDPYLVKFAKVGAVFGGGRGETAACCRILIEKLYELTESLEIPKLGEYGVTAADADKIVAASENKNNPIALGADEMKKILLERI